MLKHVCTAGIYEQNSIYRDQGVPLSVHSSDLLPQHAHGLLVSGARELQEDFIAGLWLEVSEVMHAVSADAPGQIHVFLHHSHSLGMDGAQVSVLEKTNNVGLSCLLEGLESLRLEA